MGLESINFANPFEQSGIGSYAAGSRVVNFDPTEHFAYVVR